MKVYANSIYLSIQFLSAWFFSEKIRFRTYHKHSFTFHAGKLPSLLLLFFVPISRCSAKQFGRPARLRTIQCPAPDFAALSCFTFINSKKRHIHSMYRFLLSLYILLYQSIFVMDKQTAIRQLCAIKSIAFFGLFDSVWTLSAVRTTCATHPFAPSI